MPLRQLSLACEIVRAGETVDLSYCLAGALKDVVLPQKKEIDSVLRLDNLWQSTCFECFFKAANSTEYHELNIAPAGDWNVYSFAEYRSGMKEETRLSSLQQSSQCSADSFILELSIPLAFLGLAGLPLRVGTSAVLEHLDGRVSHWALFHPGGRPDFHDPSGFVVEI